MPTADKSALYRRLPAVDELLRLPAVAALVAREGHAAVAEAARSVLDRMRNEIAAGRLDEKGLELALGGLSDAGIISRELRQAMRYSLRGVINATGVVLHTNLGRAPLSEKALDRIREAAAGYSNLEFDLKTGERGKRDVHTQRLFARLFAEASETATVVVNNNAAAVMLALNSLAEGGEVVVSRGELVEIGGSFRIPDVMAKSGATMREVGTTNRTRIADYESALAEKTKLLLRVHRSNFQIVGFTERPSLEELVALGKRRGIPLLEDLGSGALFDLASVGIPDEPGVMDSLRAGVDVVTYSGDKLLGGPQAGLLSGKPELIARCRSNPMFRALRVDKLSYAALEATLLAYVRQDHDAIPALRMMRMSADSVRERAEGLQAKLQRRARLKTEIVAGESVIGGGAAPGANLKTFVLAVACDGLSADELAAKLRANEPPIVVRVGEGRVLFDLRTVFPEQEPAIAAALAAVVG
ncbi:MAG: L-seryl-tRNA(Sec) selenium transferase [Candidatus Koribacter versatilis]|uniref:L-seryl-tRNA(Sec) selenium transferase n=1 Tax=Candidatus Korobacter versatilis TaxID=658062 RepID=A0A932EQV6_9BACT|nr:L-seryl-tRNA(Sec) selenium transferase [Candidatus Koribacter versatilis]